MIAGLLSEPDREALADDEAREVFVEGLRYGFVNGWRGYFDDNVALMTPWGFDVSDITLPVHLFFGDEDLMVPAATESGWRRTSECDRHSPPRRGSPVDLYEPFDEVATALAEDRRDSTGESLRSPTPHFWASPPLIPTRSDEWSTPRPSLSEPPSTADVPSARRALRPSGDSHHRLPAPRRHASITRPWP